MDQFVRDLILLASGAALALVSSLITAGLGVRARRKDARDQREAEAEKARREIEMVRAEAALQLLAPIVSATATQPGREDGYEWFFDADDVQRFADAVLLIPNTAVRDRVRDGMNLLGGWHTLLNWGTDTVEDLPYVLQRKALRFVREVLGSCVRGDESIPEVAANYLQVHAANLDLAWEARAADEAQSQAGIG